MSKQSKSILIIVGVIFIGVVLYGILSRSSKLNKFKENGIEVTATVTEVIKTKERSVSGKRRISNVLEVSFFTQTEKPDSIKTGKTIEKGEDGKYTFNFGKMKTDMGEYIKTDIDISTSQFKKFQKGDRVQVIYLSEDPYKAILKEDIE